MKDIKFIIPLTPVTKKNHQEIRYRWGQDKKTGKPKKVPFISQSEVYKRYEYEAGWYITGGVKNMKISAPINIKCLFYMPDKRRVDLPNLLNAIDDVLVKYKIIADDNCDIIVSHDGSRVIKSSANPRTEVTISFYDREVAT